MQLFEGMAPDDRQHLGSIGESLACRALEQVGYAIIAQHYRTRRGEIDIVGLENGTLVFVEVKTRRASHYGSAAESVTRMKQRRVGRMAREFLARHGFVGMACRFDVVAVEASVTPPHVEIIRNAFMDQGASNGWRSA